MLQSQTGLRPYLPLSALSSMSVAYLSTTNALIHIKVAKPAMLSPAKRATCAAESVIPTLSRIGL